MNLGGGYKIAAVELQAENMGWFFRGLSGDEDLWKITWIYGAFFLFLSKVAAVALRLLSTIDFDKPTPHEVTFLIWLQAIYCVWMLIALWRCAFNADWTIWGYFVRGVVILYVLLFCLFSYISDAILEPKEIFVKAGIVMEWQAEKWLKLSHAAHP